MIWIVALTLIMIRTIKIRFWINLRIKFTRNKIKIIIETNFINILLLILVIKLH